MGRCIAKKPGRGGLHWIGQSKEESKSGSNVNVDLTSAEQQQTGSGSSVLKLTAPPGGAPPLTQAGEQRPRQPRASSEGTKTTEWLPPGLVHVCHSGGSPGRQPELFHFPHTPPLQGFSPHSRCDRRLPQCFLFEECVTRCPDTTATIEATATNYNSTNHSEEVVEAMPPHRWY